MRKSTLYLVCLLGGGLLLSALVFIHPPAVENFHAGKLRDSRRLVRQLGLTDLCLFTEARYTRHPSQADLHSAFQDYPNAFEHYPSGSMVLPPQRLDRP